jgi:hypothetical protein
MSAPQDKSGGKDYILQILVAGLQMSKLPDFDVVCLPHILVKKSVHERAPS